MAVYYAVYNYDITKYGISNINQDKIFAVCFWIEKIIRKLRISSPINYPTTLMIHTGGYRIAGRRRRRRRREEGGGRRLKG